MDPGFYARLVAEADELVYVVDRDGRIAFAGGATVALVGYAPEERVGRNALECVHVDDREHMTAVLREVVAGPASATARFQCRVLAKSGDLRWLEVSFRNALDSPGVGGVIVRGRDVTQLVALRQRTARSDLLESLTANLHDVVLVVDAAGRIAEVFGSYERDTGWSREDLVGRSAFELAHPEDRAEAVRQLGIHVLDPRRSGPFSFEVRALRRDGGWLLCMVALANHLTNPAIRGVVATIRNVTALREAEVLLRRSQAGLDAAAWSGGVGLWEFEPATDTCRWLNDWCARHDLDSCAGANHTPRWDANIHPDDFPAVDARYWAHVAGEAPFYESEYRLRTRSGGWRWVRTRGVIAERDEAGQPRLIVGTSVDLDAQRRVQAERDRQRRQLQALAEAGPMWLNLIDRDGRVEYASRQLLGVAPEAAVGRPASSFFGDPAEAERLERFHAAIRATQQPGVHTNVLPDGRTIETYASAVVERGEVTGIATISLDVTERKRLERAVVEAVAREQRRLGHDLHDGLGQELTGVALLLKGLLAEAEAGGPRLRARLAEVIGHVNRAIESTRDLARGLAPVASAQGGLAHALPALAARWSQSGLAEVTCEVEAAAATGLDPLVAEHLYRIAQEALTNAMRHAGAGQVVLRLRRAGAHLELRVEDDGRGVPAGADLGAGLGLKIMRARAELIHGRLAIGSRAGGNGAVVTCLCDAGGGAHAAPGARAAS